jgi:transglutaminase-like putative cysteine protease
MRHLLASIGLLSAACASSTTSALEPVDTHRRNRSFEFTYEASVESVPAGAKQVRLWIPLPIDTPDQKIEDVRIVASHPYEVHEIENGFGKSVCVTSSGEPVKVQAKFKATRYETKGGKLAYAQLEESLEPDRMIPLDGKVAAVAATLPDRETSVSTAKVLYDHTLERMQYGKPEGVPWGRGDAEWACDAKLGNCTDFHSYFMGLARTKKIPARFEMGFSIPAGGDEVAKVPGYHCWAYFWSDAEGWVPVDISEADKAPEKAEYYFGTLDENRVTMTGGRDILLTPKPAKGALNFFVYPYAEVDGAEFKDVQKAFSRRNL